MAKIDPLRARTLHRAGFVLLAVAVWLGSRASSVSAQCACGIRQTQNHSVVDGEQIEPGEWPWHVGIYWWKGSKLSPPERICEGALLRHEGWVLTAASCLKDGSGSVLRIEGMVVHVGLVALQQNTEASKRFKVEDITTNDALDLALIRLKDDDDWEGMPICLTDELENWDRLYGKPAYVLQQSHRHRLGGFEIAKLQLERKVLCYGVTLGVQVIAITDNHIKLKTKESNYRQSGRGTPLYIHKPGGWTLLGISNKIQPAIPETLCQPGDFESFLNVNLNEVRQWISNEIGDEIIDSFESSTE